MQHKCPTSYLSKTMRGFFSLKLSETTFITSCATDARARFLVISPEHVTNKNNKNKFSLVTSFLYFSLAHVMSLYCTVKNQDSSAEIKTMWNTIKCKRASVTLSMEQERYWEPVSHALKVELERELSKRN